VIPDHVLDFEVKQVLTVKNSVGTEDVIFEAVIPLVVEAQTREDSEATH